MDGWFSGGSFPHCGHSEQSERMIKSRWRLACMMSTGSGLWSGLGLLSNMEETEGFLVVVFTGLNHHGDCFHEGLKRLVCGFSNNHHQRPESDMADVIQPDAITGRLVEGMWLEMETVEPMPDHPVATVLTKAFCSSLWWHRFVSVRTLMPAAELYVYPRQLLLSYPGIHRISLTFCVLHLQNVFRLCY